MIDIGNLLRKYRNSHCFTQQYVADFLEISRNAYRKWEVNKIDFSISQLEKISSLYDVDIEEIIVQSRLSKEQRLVKQKKFSVTSIA